METNERQTTKNNISEIPQLLDLKHFMDHLLSEKQYIARSRFKEELEAKDQIIQFFLVLKNSDMLDIFCQKNGLDLKEIESALDEYQNFESLIDDHNENFIQKTMKDEKDYLDRILLESDPKIVLDEDQRRVVLTDEDHCLVIAGAGAGKTTTVASRIIENFRKQIRNDKKTLLGHIILIEFFILFIIFVCDPYIFLYLASDQFIIFTF